MPALDLAATHRDRALLGAVAAGRCTALGTSLLVDGRRCADQFAAARLQTLGWLVTRPRESAGPDAPVELTAAGRAQLDAVLG